MNDRLKGKVAIITGAGRHKGLGEAIAKRFASESADVVITDIGAPSGPHLTADNIGSSPTRTPGSAATPSNNNTK